MASVGTVQAVQQRLKYWVSSPTRLRRLVAALLVQTASAVLLIWRPWPTGVAAFLLCLIVNAFLHPGSPDQQGADDDGVD